jgi:hypothetical protein
LLNLKLIEEVLFKVEKISITSFSSGSKDIRLILNFHYPPFGLINKRSKDVLKGLDGSN